MYINNKLVLILLLCLGNRYANIYFHTFSYSVSNDIFYIRCHKIQLLRIIQYTSVAPKL